MKASDASASSTSPAPNTWLARARAGGRLKSALWLLNGGLIGALVLTMANRQAERQRQQSAARETAAAAERLVESLDRRLGAAVLLQEELRAELLRATTTDVLSEMQPGRPRLALRRLKSQLEGAESDLRRFAEVAGRIAAERKVRHGTALLGEAQRRETEEQGARLEQAWLELAALEHQADWLAMRWAQSVERETAATRRAQERQVREVEQARERVERDLRQMQDALSRAHDQADRARQEAWQQVAWPGARHPQDAAVSAMPATLVQVNSGWAAPPPCPVSWGTGAALWPPFAAPFHPSPVLHAPYYGVPSYYDHGRRTRSRIIGYGVANPRVVRIGPYLVVN